MASRAGTVNAAPAAARAGRVVRPVSTSRVHRSRKWANCLPSSRPETPPQSDQRITAEYSKAGSDPGLFVFKGPSYISWETKESAAERAFFLDPSQRVRPASRYDWVSFKCLMCRPAGSGLKEENAMNIEKFTERARGFIQNAQQLALSEGHQQFAPLHLLKVLLDDDEGMSAGLDHQGRWRCQDCARRNRSGAQAHPQSVRRRWPALSEPRVVARLRHRREGRRQGWRQFRYRRAPAAGAGG